MESIANKEAHLLRQVHNLKASLETVQLQYSIERYPADFDTPKHPSLLDTLRKNRKERDEDIERQSHLISTNFFTI
ncbi:MAG: hypothetical protein F9K23_18300 [Bacteroidetes bacterium]|nr:MAG: hypothetical protein F9K23_18300 [Bacteroidota bacterium]